MPTPETRRSIEQERAGMLRSLAARRSKARRVPDVDRFVAQLERQLAWMSGLLDADEFARLEKRIRATIEAHLGRGDSKRRRPPETGVPVPAIPPGGPLPRQGGAEAPLEFRED